MKIMYNRLVISFTDKVGVWVMSKCPFWSSKKEKISCSNECPMSPAKNQIRLFLKRLLMMILCIHKIQAWSI